MLWQIRPGFVGGVATLVAAGPPPDVTAPTITSSATTSVNENAVLAHSLTADEAVTWSIVSGTDQAKFEISGSTLRWLSNGTKDFEAPDDADTNNIYLVIVRATDTALNTTDQGISVTVLDVSELVPRDAMLLDAFVNFDGARDAQVGGTFVNEP